MNNVKSILTREDIESFGFEFVVRDNDIEEFTFKKKSEKENYYYALVWRGDLERVVICVHDNKFLMIERLFVGLIKDKKTLKNIIELVTPTTLI